ncbi:MAG: 30S ribosomal protein S9 [Planctomycetota bacterium]|jgi:small subunit ribosomal protein S9
MSDETTNTPEETPEATPAEEPKAQSPKADAEPKAEKPSGDDAPTNGADGADDADGGDVADGAGAAEDQEAAPEPSPVDQGPTPWPADKEKNGYIWGTGRRKSSVARVRMRPGTGQFFVNDKPYAEYFTSNKGRGLAVSALEDTKRVGNYDIFVRATGGGNVGHIARCLKMAEPLLEPTLREHGHLTRDSRQKERKKYGRRGARRGFQFSKR